MNLEELKEFLEENFGPDYKISTDKHGQVIIHTGMGEDSEGELVPLDELDEAEYEDVDDNDFDLDEDEEEDD